MILLVFAHPIEARATIEKLRATPVEGGSLYRYDGGHLLISGVGPINAGIQVGRHLHLCDEVVNVGFAGGLRPGLALGEFGWVGQTQNFLSFAEKTPQNAIDLIHRHNVPIGLESGEWSLVTSHYPIHSSSLRDALAADHHVVDMEGYAIARAATLAGKRCRIGKLVSDPACEGGWETIKRHQERFSALLSEQIV